MPTFKETWGPLTFEETETVRRLLREERAYQLRMTEKAKRPVGSANGPQSETHRELLRLWIGRAECKINRLKRYIPSMFKPIRRPVSEVIEGFDFARYLESVGIRNLRRTGDRATALCPFHEDRLNSISFDFDRKLWNCFACGEGGDCLSFIMRFESCDFKKALEICNEQ